ncbi:MAG: class I SAM-dependent methyltransferase [Candidatus Methylomirabilia bacterium]
MKVLLGSGITPGLLALLEAEELSDTTALDVGCGTGRLAQLLATRCRHVIGVDRDEEAIREGRTRAAALGLSNVEFFVADVEAVEYDDWHPGLVGAHLCMSDAIIERASRALAPGQLLAFVCFHADHWRETGVLSRYAYDETRLRSVLTANGFTVEHLEVEQEICQFSSVHEAVASVAGLQAKWEGRGRWRRYLEFLEGGGRTLTRSRLVVAARRG